MILRVGCVSYINALPLHLPFKLRHIESDAAFVYDIPSNLNTMLQREQLDVALTSSVEYLDRKYEVLPGFGIAGLKDILSVNLYSQFPPSTLSGKRVGLTHHSATSSALLKVLCRHLWNVEPAFEPLNRDEPFSNYAALLLIGDEALENLSIPHFQTFDLATAWHDLTALPFVFAVFSIGKNASPHLLAPFQQQLEEALQWSDKNKNSVANEALQQLPLAPELIHHYYSLLYYRLGEKEMESLKTFNFLRK